MKIAVIVPVFNAARFLPRCLRSLDAQAFRDFTAIFVDDGSTDDSPRILEEYRAGHPSVRVITIPNSGVSAARNAALDLALADPSITHVMFLDADDAYAGDCLDRTAELAEEEPKAVIEFDFEAVDENGKVIRRYSSEGNNIWCRCYPREAVDGIRFFTGANVAEDIAFNLEIAHRRAPSVLRLEEPLYLYTENPASAMNRRFTSADFRRRSALVEYLIAVYSDSADATEEFARTDLPDLLKQFYRQLQRTDPSERSAAEKEFRRLLKSLAERGLLKSRRGRFKDLKYYFKFLLMAR